MNEESKRDDANEEDSEAATHGDMSLWGGRLQEQIVGLKADVSDIKDTMVTRDDLQGLATKEELKMLATKEELGSLRRSVEAILVVVEENNQLLKEVRRLPERVEKLERSVFRR